MKKIMRLIYFSVFLCILLIDGVCNAFAEDITKKYSPDKFLVASGVGETPQSATESARLEIAKYFESKISGSTNVREGAKSVTVKGRSSETRFTEIVNDIVISASREIPGIEFPLIEKDKKTNSYKAWGVLDKNKYISYLEEKVQKNGEIVNQNLSEPKPGDMGMLFSLSNALKACKEQEKCRGDLALLGVNGMESKNSIINRLTVSIDSLLADVFDVGVVFIKAENIIKNATIKGLTDSGIRVKEYPDLDSAKNNGADLIVKVEHEVTPRSSEIKSNNKVFTFHFSDWVFSTSAVIPETQETIDTLVQKNKSNGSSPEQANERMIAQILKTEVPGITDWIYKVIFKPSN